MAVKLRLNKKSKVPVNAECVSPNVFAGKSLDEIRELRIWQGNRQRVLGDLFEIEGICEQTPGEMLIQLVGNLSTVHRIGSEMDDGEVKIVGDAGTGLGEAMKGGRITVEGNAGSWVGSAMKGGFIEVKRNAGNYVGAAYRGSTQGMQGGSIIIGGDAGDEVGCYMKNGLIKVCSNVGQFAGANMKNGTIVVFGKAEERAGAFMKGGKIILCNRVTSVLPTFTFDGLKGKAKAEGETFEGAFYLFVGDLAENGTGKLYVSKKHNPQLKSFERLL